MPPEKLLLGIDIGTQAVKALLVGLGGCIVSQSCVERGPSHPHSGWVEMNPEQDLWGTVLQVVRKLFTSTDISPKAVEVVGVSGLVPCLCPIDEAGSPVGEMILYSDNRALQELDWVNQTAGLNLTAEAVIPKLVWIRDHEPERYARIQTVFSAHNYIVYRLTGERCIDYDTAAILGGIFDNQNKSWAAGICQKLNLPRGLFPSPRPATDLAGWITVQAAQQTGLQAGVPVIAGSGDTFPTMIGCGVVDPGDAMVSFGTTGLMTLTRKPLVDSARGPHFDDGSGHQSVAWVANVLSAGQLVRWYCEQFAQAQAAVASRSGGSLHALLDAEAGRCPPGAEGLIVLPHWLGRRTPTPDALIRGAVIGLTPSHTPSHIYRAILEAFAYNLRQTYTEARPSILRLVATAGGARSQLWRQIVTNVLNAPMEYYPASSGSLGIAFLAGYAAGLIADFGDIKHTWLRNPQITQPDQTAAATYDLYFKIYCEFEQQMTTPFAHLAQVAQNRM
ncbi:MAG: FGGY family carbohydrate kinase [Anaerolineaceae bacterium]|nr:FGGY family carbohydrate kinase [Anaerolineaceae bacterium]